MNKENVSLVRIPRQLLLFSLGIALVTPFLARLPGIAVHGGDWFISYFPGLFGPVFISAFNAIYGGALYLIGRLTKKAPLAYWSAVASSAGFVMWAHGSINLSSSSTAAIGLIFIPVYCAAATVPGAVLGWILHRSIKSERGKAIAWTICVVSLAVGTISAFQDQAQVAQRESKFPVLSVSKIALVKRTVLGSEECGRVEVLALENFDSKPGNEIAVLGNDVSILLNPDTYVVQSKRILQKSQCDRCVGMYPYVAADGKGNYVIVSSDGVTDSSGRFLWKLNRSSFAKIVPLQLSAGGELTYFSVEVPSRFERHDAQGDVVWNIQGPFLDVGIYEWIKGARLPGTRSAHNESEELRLYSLDGRQLHSLDLPKWPRNVSSVAWPSPGHLLIGAGSWLGVIDNNGREILRHQIQGTSFQPYHGPDGVAVKFNPDEASYLAVVSHGSSGYARSVLLIFDPKGHLVWQEEVRKLRTIVANPKRGTKGEVLLVGGVDGVIEYSLEDISGKDKTKNK